MALRTGYLISRRKYHTIASGAVRAEKRGDWQLAATLWAQAEEQAHGTLSHLWSRARCEFCISAARNGWEVRPESCAV